MRIYKIYNWIVVAYFVLVTAFILLGRIAFGHGFGDIVYLLFTIFCLLLHLTLTGIMHSRQNQIGWRKSFLICGTAFLIIALYLTYKFTFGRGPEFTWDGRIFL